MEPVLLEAVHAKLKSVLWHAWETLRFPLFVQQAEPGKILLVHVILSPTKDPRNIAIGIVQGGLVYIKSL
jgi:hypothetical protein